ncbi:uncharacterized protein LOC123215980 isoform X2 [Mangifera indica]|uniref:uncharacterized protein LOC123215980 isoform X2 n=2 Tax=Mangifera indica TaxID=29780 RepID=UPI001CFA892C|nr:uncharacterized protein LOC123215980 isoform X2 [Mangifera indica]
MASSLNGLSVGGSLSENLMESPARDELSMQYSPMSEDSDDSRFCEAHIITCLSQSDSLPTSPVSPYRYQRPHSGFSSAPSTSSNPSHSCTVSGSQPRQRGSDSEGRFPSSPSDICHSADLRRAALLRSVQMRTLPPGTPSFEQEPCSYIKSLVDEREYQIEECSSLRMSEPGFSQEKSCRMLNMNIKGDESQG